MTASSSPARNAPAGPALWRVLSAVAAAWQQVEQGRSTTSALQPVPAALRPATQALLFHVLRHAGTAQALRKLLVPRSPGRATEALLCTALALASDPETLPYTPFTLVDQAVEAAKRDGAMRRQSGLVNACLRRFLRESDALLAQVRTQPAARWNHPAWWVERLQRDWPQQWQAILEANNQAAPLVLRVYEHRVAVDAYQALLREAGLDSVRVGPQALALERAVPVHQLPHFAEGWVSVQDAGAQHAAPLLLDAVRWPSERPLRILDACAAPGGKTAHLLELAQGRGQSVEVFALDIDAQRCERIRDNLQRIGLQATVLDRDAGAPDTWWEAAGSRPFDAILLDAPCTASGIVRRHPDVRWLRRDSDVEQLAAIQARLLDTLWPLVAPGGHLLYCTCSVFRAEGQAQVDAFLQRHPAAGILSAPGHLFPTRGTRSGAKGDDACQEHDGFFYALLHQPEPAH